MVSSFKYFKQLYQNVLTFPTDGIIDWAVAQAVFSNTRLRSAVPGFASVIL